MKRITMVLIIGLFFVTPVKAEDAPASKASTTTTETAMAAPAAPAAATMTAPKAAEEPATPAMTEAAPATENAPAVKAVKTTTEKAENLEFVSGEVSGMDETAKSLTIKLYGETENAPTDKTLKVTVDSNTDITDGEQDRALKTLSAGTEVDVEYDPATNKATYVFVY